MRKIQTQHIPKTAGAAINLNLAALFNRIIGGISLFFQGIFGNRTQG